MTVKNLWAERGVSHYPLVMPLIGQKKVYENLREALDADETGSLSSFVVLRGEWGAGKSRIGHQLAAESLGQGKSWLIEEKEVEPLFPGDFSDKRLVFYLRYKDIYDLKIDINVEQWIDLATLAAFEYLFRKPPGAIMVNFYRSLKESLQKSGVHLETLQDIILRDDLSTEEKIRSALAYLKDVASIERLWIIVDEIEMPGEEDDIRPSMKEDNSNFYISMLKEVIRDESFRGTFPQINFALLSSQAAYSRLSSSGASERRLNWCSVEDLNLIDIMQLKKWMEEEQSFSYPADVFPAVYFASGRNMGWFNILMSHVHQKIAHGQKRIGTILKEYVQNEMDDGRLFDNGALDYIDMKSLHKEEKEELLSYICRQVPMEMRKSHHLYERFHAVKYKGEEEVLQEIIPVSMTATDLLRELKIAGYRESKNHSLKLQKEGITIRSDLLLKTLIGFSKPITGCDDFLIYKKGKELEEQLKVLYPNERVYQDVNTLKEIFSRYRLEKRSFLGPSFLILQALNKQYSLKEKREKVFSLEDQEKMERIEEEVDGLPGHKRLSALVLGMVKIFVSHDKKDWKAESPFPFTLEAAYCIKDIEGHFHVEPSQGLYILGYKGVGNTTKDLVSIANKMRGPILLVFTSSSDEKDLFMSLEDQGYEMQDLIIPIVIDYSSTMAQFFIRYSYRGDFFGDADLTVSSKQYKRELLEKFTLMGKEWLLKLKELGLLNLPIFKVTTKMQKWLDPLIHALKILAQGESFEDLLDKDRGLLSPKDLAAFQSASREWSRDDWRVLQLFNTMDRDGDVLEVPPLWRSILRRCSSRGMNDKDLERQFFFPKGEIQGISPYGSILQSIRFLVGLNLLQEGEDGAYSIVKAGSLKSRLEKLLQRLASYQELSKALSQYYSWCQGVMEGVYPSNIKLSKKELEESIASISKIEEMDIFCEERPKDFWSAVSLLSRALKKVDPIYQQDHELEGLTQDKLLTSLGQVEGLYNDLPIFIKLDVLNLLKTILQERGQTLEEMLKNRRDEVDTFREFTVEDIKLSLPVGILVKTYEALSKELQLLHGQSHPGQGEMTIRLSHDNENRESIAVSLGNRCFSEAMKKIEEYERLIAKSDPASLSHRFSILKGGMGSAFENVLSSYQWIKQLQKYFQSEPSLYDKYVRNEEKSLKNLEQNILALSKKAVIEDYSLETIDYSIREFKKIAGEVLNNLKERRGKIEGELLKRIDQHKLEMVNKAALFKEREMVISESTMRFREKNTYQDQASFVQRLNSQMDEEGKRLCGSSHLWSAYQRLFKEVENYGGKRAFSDEKDIIDLQKAGVIGVTRILEVTL